MTLARSAAVSVRASRWRCKAAQELGEPHERIEMKKNSVWEESALLFSVLCEALFFGTSVGYIVKLVFYFYFISKFFLCLLQPVTNMFL